MKEPPEELLERAFKEWVELREDMEDAEFIRELKARGDDEDWVPHEEVIKGPRLVSQAVNRDP